MVIRCNHYDVDGNAIGDGCKAGNQCRFLHPSDLGWKHAEPSSKRLAIPASSTTPSRIIAPTLAKAQTPSSPAHGPSRCRFFDDKGKEVGAGCPHPNCRFLHPTDSGWAVARRDRRPAPRCDYFDDDGRPLGRGCPYPQKCHYVHPKDQEWDTAHRRGKRNSDPASLRKRQDPGGRRRSRSPDRFSYRQERGWNSHSPSRDRDRYRSFRQRARSRSPTLGTRYRGRSRSRSRERRSRAETRKDRTRDYYRRRSSSTEPQRRSRSPPYGKRREHLNSVGLYDDSIPTEDANNRQDSSSFSVTSSSTVTARPALNSSLRGVALDKLGDGVYYTEIVYTLNYCIQLLQQATESGNVNERDFEEALEHLQILFTNGSSMGDKINVENRDAKGTREQLHNQTGELRGDLTAFQDKLQIYITANRDLMGEFEEISICAKRGMELLRTTQRIDTILQAVVDDPSWGFRTEGSDTPTLKGELKEEGNPSLTKQQTLADSQANASTAETPAASTATGFWALLRNTLGF